MDKRRVAYALLIAGGIIELASGISHVFFPSILDWDANLVEKTSIILGMEVSHITFLKLTNNEVAFILIGIAVLSFAYAPGLKKGSRSSLYFCLYWSAFLAYRSVIQLYYFGFTKLSMITLASVLLLLAFYLFPLVFYREIIGEGSGE